MVPSGRSTAALTNLHLIHHSYHVNCHNFLMPMPSYEISSYDFFVNIPISISNASTKGNQTDRHSQTVTDSHQGHHACARSSGSIIIKMHSILKNKKYLWRHNCSKSEKVTLWIYSTTLLRKELLSELIKFTT